MLNLVNELDPILKTTTELYDFSNNEDPFKIIVDMLDCMLSNNGIGLAAPQIGISKSLFIMGTKEKYKAIFNPKIIEKSEELISSKEGCLSFKGLYLNIPRSKSVIVQYYDVKGDLIEDRFEDLWARCFQHEYDHLNGICFTQLTGKTSLFMAKQKRKKLLKRN